MCFLCPICCSGLANPRKAGVKIVLAGNVGGPIFSPSVNGMSVAEELPAPRLAAFVRAFVRANAGAVQELVAELRAELVARPKRARGMKPHSKNAKDVMETAWEDWFLNAAEIHLQKVGDTEMPAHFDGGASIVLLAVTLWGDRSLRCWERDGTAFELRTHPGHVYISSLCGFKHQVCHAAASPFADKWCSSVLGDTEAVLIVRCSLFRHDRARTANALFKVDGHLCAVMTKCVAAWLAKEPLSLPSLAAIARELAQ